MERDPVGHPFISPLTSDPVSFPHFCQCPQRPILVVPHGDHWLDGQAECPQGRRQLVSGGLPQVRVLRDDPNMSPTEVPQHGEEHAGRQWQRLQVGGVHPSFVHVRLEAPPREDPNIPLSGVQGGRGAVAWVSGAQESSTITFQLCESSKGAGGLAVLVDQRVVIPVAFVEVGVLVNAGSGKACSYVREGL